MTIASAGAVTVFDEGGNVVLSVPARSARYESASVGAASLLYVEAETSFDQCNALMGRSGEAFYVTTKMRNESGSHVYAMHDAALEAIDSLDPATSRISFSGVPRRISD